jgi:glyoxylase-like metal-dependent hydrolase (beta-lactamase superfamily II)
MTPNTKQAAVIAMERFRIGDIDVVKIPESCGPSSATLDQIFRGFPPDTIERHAAWLAPAMLEPGTGRLIGSVHGWLVRTRHFNVLVEVCSGNSKVRPNFRAAHGLDTPWLERLRAGGCSPEDIDYVFCSHFHVDHVGWNTKLLDSRWVPTFPNARYLMSRREYNNWTPALRTLPPTHFNADVFTDSVLPVVAAGQAVFFEDNHQIDDRLTIEPSPGHTLGHCSLRASDLGCTGIFCGDIMHLSLQMAYPHVVTHGCEDPDLVRQTRHAVLEECSEHGHLLMPAHFPPPYSSIRVESAGAGFAICGLDGMRRSVAAIGAISI